MNVKEIDGLEKKYGVKGDMDQLFLRMGISHDEMKSSVESSKRISL